MARKRSKDRQREIYEWARGSVSNIGVVTPLPYDIIFNHIKEKNVIDIVNLFFNRATSKVDLLDQCVLEQFWWVKPEISHARYSKIEHPSHYSGEYIFDLMNNDRTIIEVRQPDIDGRHWSAGHLHIKRGEVDPGCSHQIKNVNFNEHIELTSSVISGVYVMRGPTE